MRTLFIGAILLAPLVIPQSLPSTTSPFAGAWDMVLTAADGTTSPRWMDYVEGRDPLIRIQPAGGSVHPAYDVDVDGPHITLVMNKATDKRPATTWDLKIKNKIITGTQKTGDEIAQIRGVKAPDLKREIPKQWTKAEPLFDGKTLSGWEAFPATAKNNWIAEDGALVNTEHGANIKTTRKFEDFKLHIELNCPEGGNSGVYLRGRYEMQVEYEKTAEDPYHSMGSIYGFLAPAIMFDRKPGTWESFDITLVGRNLTIVRNKIKTIDGRDIPGITGGALDSNEGEPGPFYIQGDHTGGMKYRNITIQLPKQ